MTDIQEIAYDALRDMYSEAEPPLDFDDVLENPNNYPDEWYSNYYLDSDRQKEIVKEYENEHNLHDVESLQLSMIAIIDLGPSTVK